MDQLLYSVADGIGTVTFNRPQARNAMTWAMYDGLIQACRSADEDPTVRVLVVTGAGEKAFAAGTDISQFRCFKGPEDAVSYERRIDEVLATLERCRKPTIAAIAGACTGGGFGIAACCDLRIATANSRFGFPIAKTLGNCLNMTNLARLSALMGSARLKECIFTARLFEAPEALSMGLVSEVLPDFAALQARTLSLANHVVSLAPLTLQATKEQLLLLRPPISEDEALISMCYGSRDFGEGMEAFLNKRSPTWTGT